MKPVASPLIALCLGQAIALGALADRVADIPPQQRQAYFGDLHLHTTYSFDAFVLMGTRVDPDTAYRFARGDTVDYLGEPVRRQRPLDFLAITDHAENIGFFNQLDDPDSEFSRSEFGQGIAQQLADDRPMEALMEIARYQLEGQAIPGPSPEQVGRDTWQRLVDAANRYYQPGVFTTFIGYEWTAMIDGANLHRNVIFRGDGAPAPFSSADSRDPEDLWTYLETIREQGHEALAIPHNSNASDGMMFDWVRLDGEPIDRVYAERRALNEPLSEIAQNKGTSETHPILSPQDEFASFELFEKMLTLPPRDGRVPGSYMREALGRGLVIEERVGANPYKFGFVGGSDLHSGLALEDEGGYAGDTGRMNIGGGRPDRDEAAIVLDPALSSDPHTGLNATVASSGTLTGVWAESNTREHLYDALRRREVFATSGPQIRVRLFGGWDFSPEVLMSGDWVATGYGAGVPMGGNLTAAPGGDAVPNFLVWALKDPDSAALDRVQVVKVWLEDGEHREKVFDVVWAGDRQPDPASGQLPPVGNSVDLKTGLYDNRIGATELHALWRDPEFHRDQAAAYYLRVLEIPTPRWSTLLAIEHGLPLPDDIPATLQERAWSSPIWYVPTQRDREKL